MYKEIFKILFDIPNILNIYLLALFWWVRANILSFTDSSNAKQRLRRSANVASVFGICQAFPFSKSSCTKETIKSNNFRF